MHMTYVHGDPATLRSQASALETASTNISNSAGQLALLGDSATLIAGDNETSKSFKRELSRLHGRLMTASSYFAKASIVMSSLAHQIEGAESSAESSFHTHGSPGRDSHDYEFFKEMGIIPAQNTVLRARQDAASALDRLARAAPTAPHTQSFISAFGDSVVNFDKDIAGALYGLGKGLVVTGYHVGRFVIYDGTTRVFVDPAGWEKSWGGVLHGIGTAVTHPGQVISGVYHAVVNPELLHKDPAAWLAVTAATLLGGGKVPEVVEGVVAGSRAAAIAARIGEGLPIVRAASGAASDWATELNHLAPKTVYIVDNRFVYVTDGAGRVTKASTTLDRLSGGDRSGYQQTKAGGTDRLPTDQGGHIFGSVFGAPGERINLTAMDQGVNQKTYRAMEKTWQDDVASGKKIDVEVDIRYPKGSQRPSSYNVNWTVDDKAYSQEFENYQ
jgi:hypothetical protein